MSLPTAPQPFHIPLERRKFLKVLALASASWTLPGYLAEALTYAPNVTQGPYYPLAKNIPLDDDNDLIYLNNSTTVAAGIITYVGGRVLDSSGSPVKNALVEIWHADNGGEYIYSASATRNSKADANFQGFGQFLTGSSGQYMFRTVKAGLYNGRTRHYHVAVTIPGQKTRFCTQLFWNETAYAANGTAWATQNSNDMVLQGVTNTAQRSSILLNYAAVNDGTGAVAATWDFVVNQTPLEPTYPTSGGFITSGAMVAGAGSAPRYQLNIPTYAGYTYEVYGNPTMADTSWTALPFSLTQTGAADRNRHTATADGLLSVFLNAAATKGFYHVAFRVPGANVGTP